MSDKNIRTGLRELQTVGPEIASHILGDLAAAERFACFAKDVLAYAIHNSGQCRHCYPSLWKGPNDAAEAEQSRAIITDEGAVISNCCRGHIIGDSSQPNPRSVLHGWCSNWDWTETSCSCECHCFVKRRRRLAKAKI